MRQFLCRRLLRVRIGSALSKACPLQNDVLQESTLRVILFTVAINGVIGVLPDGVYSFLCAEDLRISFSGVKISLIKQLAINRVSPWGIMSGFRFSASKTVTMRWVGTSKMGEITNSVHHP